MERRSEVVEAEVEEVVEDIPSRTILPYLQLTMMRSISKRTNRWTVSILEIPADANVRGAERIAKLIPCRCSFLRIRTVAVRW